MNPSPSLLNQSLRGKAQRLRPFYFIVVVWGKRYTDYLLDYCIPSLLSPGNIPALLNSGNKFLIATTDEDWARMQTQPIFQLLKQHVEPVFIRIPTHSAEANKYLHMGIGHKLATHLAFEDRAYAAILTPDLVVSEGTVAALQRHAVNGIQVVLTAALRFGEEPLIEHFKRLGIAALDSRSGDEAKPLVVTGRQLVEAGIRSFHSETLSFEWESAHFSDFPVAVWWRVPEEDGIIVHSLSWAPLLIDYAAVKQHDTSMLENWVIDGDYIHRNFGTGSTVHVVQDSDEIMIMSWGPLGDDAISLVPKQIFKGPWSGWEKKMILHNMVFHHQVDPLKRKIFSKPVYWHTRDINDTWGVLEKKAAKIIHKTRFAGPIRKVLFAHIPKWRYLVKRHKEGLGVYLKSAFLYYYKNRKQTWILIRQAIRGDPAAKNRIKRSLRLFNSYLTGDPNKKND